MELLKYFKASLMKSNENRCVTSVQECEQVNVLSAYLRKLALNLLALVILFIRLQLTKHYRYLVSSI